jgi:transposase
MRRHGSPEEWERIRRKAIARHRQGREFREIAQALDRSVRSVQTWVKTRREQGLAALRSKPHPGREPKLSAVQRRDLRRRLLAGPRANGFATDLWTGPRVRQLIQPRYGVAYPVRDVPQVLGELGFTGQKPPRQARQRDPAAVPQWIRRDGERIPKRRPA